MNDLVSVLEGAEADNFRFFQEATVGATDFGSIFQFSKTLLKINYQEVGFNLFLIRLPNILLLILTLSGFFWWGKKLFGVQTILLTLLILSSTFLVLTFAKFATLDIWLLSFQLLSFTSLILLLKQPIWKWRILFWLFTFGAFLVEPKSAIVFLFGAWLFLLFAHPNGKRMFHFLDVLMWLILALLAFFFDGLKGDGSGFFFNYSHTSPGEYLVANLIGVLPWLAFLPAALFDLFQKLRKREEMAIIGFAFLLFGALSFGLILQVAFAFLIAKQIENYFKPNYPFANTVKSVAVLNLLFSFALVSVFLLAGYDIFREIGFRSRMGMSGVYWAFGFLAVIGLFGENKKMIVGGMSLAGTLTMLMFWTQVSPLLENYRNLPQKLVSEIEKISPGEQPKIYLPGSSFSARTEIYLKAKNFQFDYLRDHESLNNKTGIFILDTANYNRLDSVFIKNTKPIQISGRDRIFDQEKKLWILRN